MNFFDEDYVAAIKRLILPTSPKPDKLVWIVEISDS